ncbi:ATP-binding protein [Mesorhizobium sp. M0106]|uniref:ATP-binding protein n=1 Tax=Mesorhizobium sp. M0106 TaxID=2956880 RepID=UPI0033382751
MASLDDYLTGQFHSDKQEVRKLEATIAETCRTLLSTLDDTFAWPYRIARNNAAKSATKVSHSTTAMVALALQKALGAWHDPFRPQSSQKIDLHLFGGGDAEKERRPRALEAVETACKLLRTSTITGGVVATESGTYGINDPITLSFLASLVAGSKENRKWSAHRKYVASQVHHLIKLSPLEQYAKFFDFEGKNESEPVPNALIPLRIVQTAKSLSDLPVDLSAFRRYFETTLHDQLSFSSIPDSRFDPAELAFCLEGLLLSQQNAVDRPLFDRVLEVLTGAQKNSAFWRPTKPFLATDRGLTLFPVSVEVANSLLRSCETFDGKSLRNTVGSANISLFRRYFQWLNARKITFAAKGKAGTEEVFVGWDSEHVNQIDFIHIWESSQVLEFLIAFHRLLRAHIARTSLALSRFDVRSPHFPRQDWSKITEKYEPAASLGDEYRVYKRIGDDFLEGWLGRSSKRSYSMLLYGPPGTGKTTVAENLSEALGFPLITITVSDFLAGGEGQVEARAKAIFDVLEAQSDCIVLFDEIDAFLLDRDTTRYADQDTVFQFMTPGMLTKLNNLRKSERLIFIVATNYENRIDPAIKRTGRIDRRYLLLPYDKRGREVTISSLIGDGGAGRIPAKVVEDSLFLGYGDLRNTIVGPITRGRVNALAERLARLQRTTRLASFTNRLPDEKNESIEQKGKWPLEEFICLMALALEIEGSQLGEELIDKTACKGALKAADYLGHPVLPNFIASFASGLASDAQGRVSTFLQKIKEDGQK